MHTKKLTTRESLIHPPQSEKLKSGCVVLKPGEAVGEHTTDAREEVLVVVAGTATIIVEQESAEIQAPGFVYIPAQKMHNVTNRTETELKYVYVVTPVESEEHGCMCGNGGHCQCH